MVLKPLFKRFGVQRRCSKHLFFIDAENMLIIFACASILQFSCSWSGGRINDEVIVRSAFLTVSFVLYVANRILKNEMHKNFLVLFAFSSLLLYRVLKSAFLDCRYYADLDSSTQHSYFTRMLSSSCRTSSLASSNGRVGLTTHWVVVSLFFCSGISLKILLGCAMVAFIVLIAGAAVTHHWDFWVINVPFYIHFTLVGLLYYYAFFSIGVEILRVRRRPLRALRDLPFPFFTTLEPRALAVLPEAVINKQLSREEHLYILLRATQVPGIREVALELIAEDSAVTASLSEKDRLARVFLRSALLAYHLDQCPNPCLKPLITLVTPISPFPHIIARSKTFVSPTLQRAATPQEGRRIGGQQEVQVGSWELSPVYGKAQLLPAKVPPAFENQRTSKTFASKLSRTVGHVMQRLPLVNSCSIAATTATPNDDSACGEEATSAFLPERSRVGDMYRCPSYYHLGSSPKVRCKIGVEDFSQLERIRVATDYDLVQGSPAMNPTPSVHKRVVLPPLRLKESLTSIDVPVLVPSSSHPAVLESHLGDGEVMRHRFSRRLTGRCSATPAYTVSRQQKKSRGFLRCCGRTQPPLQAALSLSGEKPRVSSLSYNRRRCRTTLHEMLKYRIELYDELLTRSVNRMADPITTQLYTGRVSLLPCSLFQRFTPWYNHFVFWVRGVETVMAKAQWQHVVHTPRHGAWGRFVDTKIERWFLAWVSPVQARQHIVLCPLVFVATIANILMTVNIFMVEVFKSNSSIPSSQDFSSPLKGCLVYLFTRGAFHLGIVAWISHLQSAKFYNGPVNSHLYKRRASVIAFLALVLSYLDTWVHQLIIPRRPPTLHFIVLSAITFPIFSQLTTATHAWISAVLSVALLCFLPVFIPSVGSVSGTLLPLLYFALGITLWFLFVSRCVMMNYRLLFCRYVLPYLLYLDALQLPPNSPSSNDEEDEGDNDQASDFSTLTDTDLGAADTPVSDATSTTAITSLSPIVRSAYNDGS